MQSTHRHAGFYVISGGCSHRIFEWIIVIHPINPLPSPNMDAVHVWRGEENIVKCSPWGKISRGINPHAYHPAPVCLQSEH